MCGIGGIRTFNPKNRISSEEINALLLSLEDRGNDAAGVALQERDGQIYVYKDDSQASQLVQQPGYQKWVEENLKKDITTCLVHTRFATGNASPRKNDNNHPIVGKTCAIIHNGVLHDEDSTRKKHKLDSLGFEVDSSLIAEIVDKYGITKEALDAIDDISGSCACAAVDSRFPGQIMLVRSGGNPLVVGGNEKEGKFFWASEKRAIHSATRPYVKTFGIWMKEARSEYSMLNMNLNSGWIMGEKGLEWHQEVNTGNYSGTRYRTTFEGYSRRQQNYGARRGMREGVSYCEGGEYEENGDDDHEYYMCNHKEEGKSTCGNIFLIEGDEYKKWVMDTFRPTCPKCKTLILRRADYEKVRTLYVCN